MGDSQTGSQMEGKMGFSINDWKSGIADYFKKHTPKMKQGGMNVFYGLVTAGVLAPAVAAVAQSSGQEVFGQLAALLGGVGVNLVSNLIQQIKDRSEEDAAAEVQRQYEADPELRKALDTLIEKLDAINTAQRTLSDADREWFVQTLREELRQAGSTIINITIIQPDPGVQSFHHLHHHLPNTPHQ